MVQVATFFPLKPVSPKVSPSKAGRYYLSFLTMPCSLLLFLSQNKRIQIAQQSPEYRNNPDAGLVVLSVHLVDHWSTSQLGEQQFLSCSHFEINSKALFHRLFTAFLQYLNTKKAMDITITNDVYPIQTVRLIVK